MRNPFLLKPTPASILSPPMFPQILNPEQVLLNASIKAEERHGNFILFYFLPEERVLGDFLLTANPRRLPIASARSLRLHSCAHYLPTNRQVEDRTKRLTKKNQSHCKACERYKASSGRKQSAAKTPRCTALSIYCWRNFRATSGRIWYKED